MASTFDISLKRTVIPNWRDYKRTILIGELSNQTNKFKYEYTLDISRAINDWKNSKSIGIAADLINTSFISGKTNSAELGEAIEFIVAHPNTSSSSLIALAKSIKDEGNPTSPSNNKNNPILEVNSLERLQQLIDNNVIYKYINSLKQKVKTEPRNAIIWVELARLYSILGMKKKLINI